MRRWLRSHRRAARGGLLLLSSLLALAGAELLARWLRPLPPEPGEGSLQQRLAESAAVQPDAGPGLSLRGLVQPSCNPRLIYEMKPGLKATFQAVPVELNSRGFRERELPAEKPADTLRVLGIGDSVLFGWGVRQDETFLARLEQRIAAAGGQRRVEVLNFGVPGYNTMQEATQLEAIGLEYAPDAAIVCFDYNDDQLPSFVARSSGGLLEASVLWRLLQRGRGQPETPLEGQASKVWNDPQNVPWQYRSLVGPQGVEQGLQRLGYLAQVHGFPVFLFCFGPSRPMTVQVQAWCERYGIRFLDLPAFLKRRGLHWGPELRLSVQDPHPNARLHAEIGLFLHEGLGSWLAAPGK